MSATRTQREHVIWHDLECGGYRDDLGLWLELASEYGDPVLDVGAGSGRVAVELAGAGHRVTALDSDGTLLAALQERTTDRPVQTVIADARQFTIDQRFPLCLVPMQTIQLLGGHAGRQGFLRSARRHLQDGGRLAVAISEHLEPFTAQPGIPLPLPDVSERDGTVYFSQPTAIRVEGDGFVLERRREVVAPNGEHRFAEDRIRLDRLTALQLEREAAGVGFQPASRRRIPASAEYAGSTVVILHA